METKVLAQRYLTRTSVVFEHARIDGAKLIGTSRGARHLTFKFHLGNPTILDRMVADKTVESVALACNCNTVSGIRESGLIRYSYSLPRSLWKECKFADTDGFGIGVSDNERQVQYGFESPHSLVCGITGSGKTITAQAILLACIRSMNQNLEIIAIDPHDQFSMMSDSSNLIAPIALNHSDITKTLELADYRYEQRRQKKEAIDTRIIVMCDEAQEVMNGKNLEIIKKISAGGRKWQIHLMLITPKPESTKGLSQILSNIGLRFVGRVINAHTSALLTGHPGLAAHKLTGDGAFIRVEHGKQEVFQVGMVEPGDFDFIPRGQIEAPKTIIAEHEVILPEAKRPGRPAKEIEPEQLAYYLVPGVGNISHSVAKKQFGLSKEMNRRYKDFASTLKQAAGKIHKEIQAQKKG